MGSSGEAFLALCPRSCALSPPYASHSRPLSLRNPLVLQHTHPTARPASALEACPAAHPSLSPSAPQASDWPAIKELGTEVEPFASLYSITADFAAKREDWLFGSVRELDAEAVEGSVSEWLKKVRAGKEGLLGSGSDRGRRVLRGRLARVAE